MKIELSIYELRKLAILCLSASFDETLKADGSDKFWRGMHDKLKAEIDAEEARMEEKKKIRAELNYK